MKDKPIVLVANGMMNAGGTESLLMEMFRNSTGKVNYVLLIHYQDTIEKGLYDDEIEKMGISIKYIPSVGTVGIKRYISEFKKVVDSIGKVDIVHSHINGNGGIISLAAQKAGIPVRICHCHADIHFTGTKMYRLKEELVLAILKGFIEIYATERWACSRAAWRRLFLPWHKRVVIDNMINPRKYLSTTALKAKAKGDIRLPNRFIIGAVGRVAPIKNYEFVIRTLPHIPNATFVCYGRFDEANSYCKMLIDLAKELGVSSRVQFMGNSDSVPNDIQSFDVFVMPSFTEGFGIAALEAQAASIPVLVSMGIPHSIDVGLNLVKFLPIDDVMPWVVAINEIMESQMPCIIDGKIIEAFAACGKDSVNGVNNIENRYLSLCR